MYFHAKRLQCRIRVETSDHPVLDSAGLWHRADRFRWVPVRVCPYTLAEWQPRYPDAPQPLLIVGATGTLGRAFARVCARRGLACRLAGRAEMDIADRASVEAALALHRPWAVVNAAGFVRVDEAETRSERPAGARTPSARPCWRRSAPRWICRWSASPPTSSSTGGRARSMSRPIRWPR